MKRPHFVPAKERRSDEDRRDLRELLEESDERVREFLERREAERPRAHRETLAKPR